MAMFGEIQNAARSAIATAREAYLRRAFPGNSPAAGSSISGGYALKLSAEKLNTLGELDFANCDNTAANQAMDGNGEQKLRTAVNRLPPDFRFDLTPTTTFSAEFR